MSTVRFTALVGICALIGAVGCSQPESVDNYDIPQPPPVWTRVVGFVDSGGLASGPLQAPETVKADSSFAITVSTFGSSCIRPAGAVVELGASSLDITPYDSVPSGPPCLPDWWAFRRELAMTLSTAGIVHLRLHGRGFNGELLFERVITVLP